MKIPSSYQLQQNLTTLSCVSTPLMFYLFVGDKLNTKKLLVVLKCLKDVEPESEVCQSKSQGT